MEEQWVTGQLQAAHVAHPREEREAHKENTCDPYEVAKKLLNSKKMDNNMSVINSWYQRNSHMSVIYIYTYLKNS